MLYQVHNGAVMYGAETILKDIRFEIKNDKEKIAIVGRNGSGKTTLLKLIAGEVDLVKRDSDEDIYIAKTGNPSIGHLRQITFSDDTLTLEEEVKKVFAPIRSMKEKLDAMVEKMSKTSDEELVQKYTALEERFNYLGGYYYEKEYEIVLKKFGFTQEDKKKPLSEFSGGQRTKIAFVKLLLEKPDILLLDEPTNHLDMETVEWLEGYLKDYPRAVVIVSHDRMFLDHIVETVYEIEYGKIKRYVGNYSHFVEEKRKNYEKQKKDYEAQQKEIERLNTIVEKYKNTPTKVAMTRSKLKAIEHMDLIEKPERFDTRAFRTNFKPLRETGKDVLYADHLKVGYDTVLETLSLDMKRGEKIGIIGGNGIGKSTFLKTIVGTIPALGGEYHYGVNVDIGYFDQQIAQFSSNKKIIEDYWDEFPTLTETEVRTDLGCFLFTADDVFKSISSLSGGERVRLCLAKMFKTCPNFLILDEPTNHMDIVGKEALEDMLKGFEGSVIFVSHDRYFVKEVATKVLEFTENEVKVYPFGYAQYEEEHTGKVMSQPVFSKKETASLEPEKPKNINIGKERSKIEKKMEKLELQMTALEEEIQAKKDELLNPMYASSYSKLTEIQNEIDVKEEELLAVMEEWGALDQTLSEMPAN